MNTKLDIRYLVLILAGGCLAPACGRAAPPPRPAPVTVVLAEKGQARQPVVVGSNASESVRATAQLLAEYLEKISGGSFKVVIEQGQTRYFDIPVPAGQDGTLQLFSFCSFWRDTKRNLSSRACRGI